MPAAFDPLDDPLHALLGALVVALSVYSGGHALLNKSDSRSALGWLVACLGWPVVGALLYWVIGSNRIRTQRRLRESFPAESVDVRAVPARPHGGLGPELAQLVRVAGAVTGRALVGGNRVRPLHCGEEAYPRMLEAIRSAEHVVHLATYIFDNDRVGREFADALAATTGRGVDVKVLVDGVGELYSRPRICTVLRRRGVDARRFLPPSLLPPSLHVNLRNHRKILTVDGVRAFTGGMNLSDRHFVREPRRRRPVVDLHFEVEGPVVAQMDRVFLEDWAFVKGDLHSEPAVEPREVGASVCRAISDGPNEDLDKLKWILLGAISSADESVRVMTPYFVPDPELSAALVSAALRGVRVEIVLPEKLDIPFVGWASRAHLPGLLKYGVSVRLSPPPFVHTKLFLVDGRWALVGSANLDPRSLRLNFEFNLEIYGGGCVASLAEHFEEARRRARPVTEAELAERSLPVRLRDAAAFLFSPYL